MPPSGDRRGAWGGQPSTARACASMHARARPGMPRARPVHASAWLNMPVHAPCTPRARPVHAPCMCRARPSTFGHTDASLKAQSGFANGKRHLGYHTEGPRFPRPLSNERDFLKHPQWSGQPREASLGRGKPVRGSWRRTARPSGPEKRATEAFQVGIRIF